MPRHIFPRLLPYVLAAAALVVTAPTAALAAPSSLDDVLPPQSDAVVMELIDGPAVTPDGSDGPCLSAGIKLTIVERNVPQNFTTARYMNCNTTSATITPKYRKNSSLGWSWGVCVTMKSGQAVELTVLDDDAEFTYITGCR